ncbi:hypothetical protein QF033_002340 [Bacillus pumilus]|nr:hypothetical protein [Bacillus pumilus]
MDDYYRDFGYYHWVKIPLNLTPSDYLAGNYGHILIL